MTATAVVPFPQQRRSVLANTALQIAGYCVSASLAAAAAVFLTRYLGASGFGTLSVILVSVALVGAVVNGSVETFAVRAFASDGRLDPLALRSLLAFKLVVATALVAAANLIALAFPLAAPVRVALLAFGLTAVATSVQGAVFAATQSQGSFGLPVGADVAGRALSLVGIVALFAAPHPGSIGLRVALVAAVTVAVAVLVCGATLRRAHRMGLTVGLAYDAARWRELARGPLALAALALLGIANYRVDVLVLAALRDTSDVGIYACATRVVDAALPLGAAFVAASFPVLAQGAANDGAGLAARARRGTVFLGMLAVPLVAVTLLAAPFAVRVLGGVQFAPAVTPLRILALSLPFSFVSTFYLHTLIAMHRQRRVLPLVTASLLVNVVLNVALVPVFAVSGSAAATLASEVGGCLVLARMVRQAVEEQA